MIHPPGTDSFNFLVTDIARLIRGEFERRVTDARIGVTAAEARVLVHAARRGPVRQTVLAESLGVSQMCLTEFVNRLENAGLVERVTDPHDRRANLISLTGKSNSVLEAVLRIGREVTEVASGDAGGQVMEVLRKDLCAIRDRLEESRRLSSGKTADTP